MSIEVIAKNYKKATVNAKPEDNTVIKQANSSVTEQANKDIKLEAKYQKVKIIYLDGTVKYLQFAPTLPEASREIIMSSNGILFNESDYSSLFKYEENNNIYTVPNLSLLSMCSVQDVLFIIQLVLQINMNNLFLDTSLDSCVYRFMLLNDIESYGWYDGLVIKIEEIKKNISKVLFQDLITKYKILLGFKYKLPNNDIVKMNVNNISILYLLDDTFSRNNIELLISLLSKLNNNYLAYADYDKYGYGQFYTTAHAGIESNIPNIMNSLIIGTTIPFKINNYDFIIKNIIFNFVNVCTITIQPHNEINIDQLMNLEEDISNEANAVLQKYFKPIKLNITLSYINMKFNTSLEHKVLQNTKMIERSIRLLSRIKFFSLTNYVCKSSINCIGFKNTILREDVDYLFNIHPYIEYLRNFGYLRYFMPEMLISVTNEKVEFKINNIESINDLKLNLIFILNSLTIDENITYYEIEDLVDVDINSLSSDERDNIIKKIRIKYKNYTDQKYYLNVYPNFDDVIFATHEINGVTIPYSKYTQGSNSRIALITKDEYNFIKQYIKGDNSLNLSHDCILMLPNQTNSELNNYMFCPDEKNRHITFRGVESDVCVPKCVITKDNIKQKVLCYSKLNVNRDMNELSFSYDLCVTNFNPKHTNLLYKVPHILSPLFNGYLVYVSEDEPINYKLIITISRMAYFIKFGEGDLIFFKYKSYYFLLHTREEVVTYDVLIKNTIVEDFMKYIHRTKYDSYVKFFIQFLSSLKDVSLPVKFLTFNTNQFTVTEEMFDALMKYCSENKIEIFNNLVKFKNKLYFTNIAEKFIHTKSTEIYKRDTNAPDYDEFPNADYFLVNIYDNHIYAAIWNDVIFYIKYQTIPAKLRDSSKLVYQIFEFTKKENGNYKFMNLNLDIEKFIINKLFTIQTKVDKKEEKIMENYSINKKFNLIDRDMFKYVFIAPNDVFNWNWRGSTNF